MSKEIEVNPQKMTAEIDCSKNGLFAVKDGRVVAIEPPKEGFGDQLLKWQHGKVMTVKTESIQKI